MIFEIEEYCFIKLIKWKFKFLNFLSENTAFLIDQNFGSIDRNGKILKPLDVSMLLDSYSTDWKEHSIDQK